MYSKCLPKYPSLQFLKKLQWCPGRSSKAGAEIGWSPDRGVKTKKHYKNSNKLNRMQS